MNSALDHTREFPFSPEHFRVITDRIYRFSGIKLPEAKREMVYARLARRLRSLGLASFDDYVRYLEAEPSEWEHCTNALTTNVTSFFREEHHFRVLAEHAQARAGKAGAYRVWSAGCSTGEEPYSIAMTLADTLHASNYHIVASDLDTQVLATARHAVYPLGSVLKLPESRQKRFFLRGTGRNDGRARVRPEIASHVEFARVNLMDAEWGVEPPFDAIFCRNVMIYFDKPTQRRLIERYARMLSPGGLFFAGHAESLLDQGRVFKLRGQTVYELAR
ncbi:MAG TPA: CheR family methyltransferase [Usitatibacter sp.]|jgi:chemotaxis protein methyltransferase CheR|nr:CheR family methyltransferase [Usitatibacter sp.]